MFSSLFKRNALRAIYKAEHKYWRTIRKQILSADTTLSTLIYPPIIFGPNLILLSYWQEAAFFSEERQHYISLIRTKTEELKFCRSELIINLKGGV